MIAIPTLLLLLSQQASDTLLVQGIQRGITAAINASVIGGSSAAGRAFVVDSLAFKQALGQEATTSLRITAITEHTTLGARSAVMTCSPQCSMPDQTVLVELRGVTVRGDRAEATVLLTWSRPLYLNGALYSRGTESSTSTVILARKSTTWAVQEVQPRRSQR